MTGGHRGHEDPPLEALVWDDLNQADQQYLRRAIELGRRGWGRVHPNPMVGCVLAESGRVIAEGAHQAFGEDHAERVALDGVAGSTQGATAYVSMEPCAHFGKTPPCAHALHAAGISRVVYWAADPGPTSGGGASWLRQRGVVVDGPVEDRRAWSAENPFFFHEEREGLPYVALKLAVSQDFGIAPKPGVQRWLTGPESRAEVHRIRAGFDAILVGARTWGTDDPRLTVRGDAASGGNQPARVLLDRRAEVTLTARVFEDQHAPVWIVTSPEAEPDLVGRLGPAARVLPVSVGVDGLDTRAVLRALRVQGARTVLCEGGGALGASLLLEDVVRRFYLFRTPVALGDGRVPAFPRGQSPISEADQTATDGWIPVGQPKRYGEDILTIFDRGE